MPRIPNPYIPKGQNPLVLVIGHSLDVDIECVEWDSPEPNVADYDVVIMDLTTAQTTQLPPPQAFSVQPRLHQVDMSRYLQWPHIRRSIGRLLLSGGRLFVITNPEIVIYPRSPRVVLHHARSTTLLPFVPFGERVPAGQSMTWVDPRFNFYFREVGQWNFILTGKLEYFYEHFGEQVTCQVHPLAKNRADDMIALSVSAWGSKSKMPGVIYLLPPPTKIASSEAIKLILAHLGDLWEISQRHAEQSQQRREPKPGAITEKTGSTQKSFPQGKTVIGIPPTTYRELRDALSDCDPFESNRKLRDIFALTSLRPWRSNLPEADSRMGRVDGVIGYLHDKHRRDGANALVLLLRVLSEQIDAEDARHQRLVSLAEDLELALGGGGSTTQPTKPKPSFQTPRSDTPKTEPLQPSYSPTSDRSAAAEESREKPREEAEKKDLFVSYNRADKQWAEWIAWQLEEVGYTTIIQAWDFRPGSNFVIDMQRAAEQARRTIAVLSPDYLQALYTQPEWAAAFAQDPTGKKGTLLPVRVRECELQGLLSQVVYIDLVGLTEQAAKEKLLVGVKQGRVKPTTAPGFPGAAERIISEQPGFPGKSSLDQGQS
jgi:hypothetical protein